MAKKFSGNGDAAAVRYFFKPATPVSGVIAVFCPAISVFCLT